MKKNTLAIIAVMASVVFLTVSTGWAQFAGIDGGYVSTSTCAICHPTIDADFQQSGHPYKYRTTNGADCGAGDCDAITNILPNPAIAGISTLTNDDLILDDGFGNLDWSVINYIIGGWGWKARFGILDATDADGDVFDDTGYIWTGANVQWNVFGDAGSIIRNQWSNYHGGEDKTYNCGTCHNTNGTRDLDNETRTEPWASNPGTPMGAGYTSQWTFDGVQCEGCHGPGETHANAPGPGTFPVDTSAEMCGTCHNRSGYDLHGADTSGGFTKHHEQYNEMMGNTLEPGVHDSLTCVSCHDPHKRTHTVPEATATAFGIADNDQTAEERGAVVSCNDCHSVVLNHADLQCIDCHMAESTKSATAVNGGSYGKMGDVKTHIFLINSDPLAEDTNASPNSVTGTNVAHNYISLNYACGKCHDSDLANYVAGTPALTMEELGDYASQIHTAPCVPETTECSAEAECGVEIDSCGDEIVCADICGSEETCVANMCEDGTDPPVGEVEIALEDYDLSIWDFSDTYTDSRDNNVLEYTLIVDVKGKVTGSGTYEAEANGVSISIPVEVKGNVKGKNSIVTLKYKVSGKDDLGNKVKDNVKLELEEMELSIPSLVGSQKRKTCLKGQGCLNNTTGFSLDVPDGMTGAALISIDVAPIDANDKRTKYEGTAELILSNGDEYPLDDAKGKYTNKKDETQYQLKGVDAVKGIKTKLKLDGRKDGPATFINGKALGQQFKYKLE